MRRRALIHIGGPASSGKTLFIEKLLGAQLGITNCARARLDPGLKKARESATARDADLQRYQKAGASRAAVYHFPGRDADAFFTTDIMEYYSEVVLVEGDDPSGLFNLTVFVVKPLPQGESLLRRVAYDPLEARRAAREKVDALLGRPPALTTAPSSADDLISALTTTPRSAEDLKLIETMLLNLLDTSVSPRTLTKRGKSRAATQAPTERWALHEDYVGIERAKLIVVHACSDEERLAARPLLDEITRLRKDEEVYRDVTSWHSNKLPITVVVADLSNPADPGLKKAIARVKRTVKQA